MSIIQDNNAKPITVFPEDDNGNRVMPVLFPNAQDGYTHGLITVSFEHHEIHEGDHYFVSGVQDLSINNVLDFTMLTPNTTKWINFTFNIETESETLWQIYEGATATNPLSGAVTPLNSNRNSANTSAAVLKFEVQNDLTAANGDTSVASATLLSQGISGAGKLSGGNASRDHELILKQNKLYCFRATATAAGYINFNMQWYEHTSKE